MPASSVTFSPVAVADVKVLLMGPCESLSHRVIDSVCSLKETEHVSAEHLFRNEAARGGPFGRVCSRALERGESIPGEAALAVFRRWFFSRKSTRGFFLSGFPATAHQAHVFDEWLDSRDESLTAAVALDASPDQPFSQLQALIRHYDERGIFLATASAGNEPAVEVILEAIAARAADR